MKRVAIMQPYFFPYIGYFQLIKAVDLFVVYDNIKYTKKGWINRNRILLNGTDAMFSLPLKGGSDSLDVRDRELATDFDPNKLLRQIEGAYRKAPHFEPTFRLIEGIMRHESRNLFSFLHNALALTCRHLGIATEIRISSRIAADHTLKEKDRVLALCKAVGASVYINPIGGVELYDKQDFANAGIELKFLRSKPFEYAQFGNGFVPSLSIIDVLMFNPIETMKECLDGNYELI